MKLFFRHFLFLLFGATALKGVELAYDFYAVNDLTIKPFWAMAQPRDQIHFAFVGSSRVQSNIDIPVFEKALKKDGINLGVGGASFWEQYTIFKLFLDRQKGLEEVFIGIDDDGFDADSFTTPFHYYHYFPWINTPSLYETLREYKGFKVFFWRYFPFFKYAEFNNEIGLINLYNMMRKKKSKWDEKGTFFLDSHDFIDTENKKTVLQISPVLSKYFEKILTLAKEKKLNVVVFYPPDHPTIRESRSNRAEIFDYYRTLCKKHGVPLYEFDLDADFLKKDYYKDARHLNRKGAHLFSKKLAALVTQSKAATF